MTGLVVDTSALMSILRREPGSVALASALASADVALASAPTLVELGLVVEGRYPDAVGRAQQAMRDGEIQVVAFDEALAVRATDAWRRFGKGRHPAGLNFGDCCTFALAEDRGLPILCVGEDFRRTGWPVLP